MSLTFLYKLNYLVRHPIHILHHNVMYKFPLLAENTDAESQPPDNETTINFLNIPSLSIFFITSFFVYDFSIKSNICFPPISNIIICYIHFDTLLIKIFLCFYFLLYHHSLFCTFFLIFYFSIKTSICFN